MPLSSAEKLAGRKFREACDRQLAAAFPDAHITSGDVHFLRHVCLKHTGRTWSVELRAYFIRSPAMWACYCSAVLLTVPHDECQGGVLVEEGLFAYVYAAGKCPCGFAARSDDSRVVLMRDRLPLRRATEIDLDASGWGV